jgi:hypothetical protein
MALELKAPGEDARRVVGAHDIGELRDGRLAPLGLLDCLDDAGERCALPGLGRLDHQRARAVERAGETGAPSRLSTGRLSPVSMLSSTAEGPRSTRPSAGMRSPGLTSSFLSGCKGLRGLRQTRAGGIGGQGGPMSTRALIWVCAAACTGKTPEEGDPGGTGPEEPEETTTDTELPTDTDTITDTGTAPPVVPEWGLAPVFVPIASAGDGLYVPRDLEFHPDHEDQLFVVNRATDSVTVLFDPGTDAQRAEEYADAFGYHFMEEVAALAFGEETAVPDGGTNSSFATCQESRNTYNGYSPPNDFMGPALWPGDLDILAQVHQNDGLLGSHLDMLHQTSYCMGIAHDSANGYWVFDGQDGEILFYDFQEPHGHGEDDHSDGRVHHYPEAVVTRVPDVPSHMELDPASGLLYIADTGTGRILVLDTTSGSVGREFPLFSNGEPLDEHLEMEGVDVSVLAEGLGQPSGLALHDGRLFVSDHETGEIIAFDLEGNELGRVAAPDGPGIMGLAVGPDGTLWYVDGQHELVVHIQPG